MNSLVGNSEFLNQPVSEENDLGDFQSVKNQEFGKYARNNPNCIDFNGWEGPLNGQNQLINDKCYESEITKQSISPGKYITSNFHPCDCKNDKLIEFATNNPYMKFRDGYGISECNVDESSRLRNGKTRKNPKCKSQLFHRPYLTVPYMGRGSGDTKVESQLLPAEDTSQSRPCNVLSGVTIDNYFMPLVKNLEDNIQNPKYLIQEDSDKRWVRGGIPTRQIVKNVDYLERCGRNL